MNEDLRIESILAEREQALLASHVCLRCGSIGGARLVLPPSGAAEAALWTLGLLLIVLGEFSVLALAPCYSIWRRTARRRICSSCEAQHTLVPGRSPKGHEELVAQGLLD